jgi:hypothetical protein
MAHLSGLLYGMRDRGHGSHERQKIDLIADPAWMFYEGTRFACGDCCAFESRPLFGSSALRGEDFRADRDPAHFLDEDHTAILTSAIPQ